MLIPNSGSGQAAPVQPPFQYFDHEQTPSPSYSPVNPFSNPHVGKPYRALWEFIVLHHHVRAAKDVICGNCQNFVLHLAAHQFKKHGCPLPPGVDWKFLDNLGRSNTLPDYKCRAIVNVIRHQGIVWRKSRPEQFRSVLHARWTAGMAEEFAAKLSFACEHSYSLMDLYKNRPFAATEGQTSYINIFKRYIAAVANPHLGTKCICPGSNWYSKPRVLSDPDGRPWEENYAKLIADGPDDWLVELEMSCIITKRRFYLDEAITRVLERNTEKELQFNDFMSPIWNTPTVEYQLRRFGIQGGEQWLHSVDAARGNLDHMYENFAVAASSSPDLKGFDFTKCKKHLDLQMQLKSWATVHCLDTVEMVLDNDPWDAPHDPRDAPDQSTTPSGKTDLVETDLVGAAQEVYDSLVFLAAFANQPVGGVKT